VLADLAAASHDGPGEKAEQANSCSHRLGIVMNLLLVLLLSSSPSNAAAENAGYKRDLAVLCDSEHLSGADKLKDPAMRAEKIAGFLSTQEFGAEYQSFFTALQGSDPCEKAKRLAEEARKSGILPCRMAESSEKESRALCARRPSLKTDIELLCRAEQASGAEKEKDPAMRYLAVYTYMLAQRVSDDFNSFFLDLHETEPCGRASKLQRQADAVRISPCRLAASWKRTWCK
jgi:hypothetical protein